jgi:hypothetical protein
MFSRDLPLDLKSSDFLVHSYVVYPFFRRRLLHFVGPYVYQTDFSRYYCFLTHTHLVIEGYPYDEENSIGLNAMIMLGNEVAGGQLTQRKLFVPNFDGLKRYGNKKCISIPYSSIISVDTVDNLCSSLVRLQVGSISNNVQLYYSVNTVLTTSPHARYTTKQFVKNLRGLLVSDSQN